MKERGKGNHQEQPRYRVDHYGKGRNFAAYEGHTIIAVTLYRKGAAEIIARLEEKDRRIAALERQLATMAESKVFPGLPLPNQCPPRHGHHRGNLALSPPRTCQPSITSSRRRPAPHQAPTLSRYTSCSARVVLINYGYRYLDPQKGTCDMTR